MQRRNLIHSRTTGLTHHSTDAVPGDREQAGRGRVIRLLAATSTVVALFATALPGAAHAQPSDQVISAPEVTSEASAPLLIPTSRTKNEDPKKSSGGSDRSDKSARPDSITPRERLAARAAIRQSVADLALKQKGKAYGSGRSGPDAFDCSGFTLFAWRSVGVQLTHYSAGQYQQVRRISAKAAKPGDLVFYLNRGARHVGMYIGDGMIVHSSDYGVGVIVTPVIGTPWTNAHFTGFGRVPIPESLVEDMVSELRERRSSR